MKAIAVIPRQSDSLHLTDLPMPSSKIFHMAGGVLVQVLRVGVDGTDKKINAAEYGRRRPGMTFSSSAMNASGV